MRELEDVVKACRSTCKYAQDADANSPDQTARYYGRFRAQAAAAERAAIVAWMKQRNEDIDRPGLDGAIWAREIERAHHLTEAQRTTDACRFNDCPPKDCADCDEHRLQRERAAGNFEAQLLADSTDPKRTAEGG